jgi:hypothetical protein
MMAEEMRELDNLSRTIGGLEQGQRETKTAVDRLEVKIETMVQRFEQVISEVRRNYHELNNEAMKQIGRIEMEHEKKLAELDRNYGRRLEDLEKIGNERSGERRVWSGFWGLGTAVIASIATVVIEYLARHLP